jgi:hypothetical protein
MLKFGEFIAEGGYHVPVVSISKDKVDLSDFTTRNEINRNIAAELSREWMNPYGGWSRIRKILSLYNIFLPNVIFKDEEEGEEIVVLSQFGDKWGASLNGTITSPNDADTPEYYLYYSYGISEHGFYKAEAKVTDEEGINKYLDTIPGDEVESDFLDTYGEKDPRQP